MTSRLQYILLFAIYFVVLTILLYFVFEEQKIYFLVSELGLLILLLLAFKVYQNIFKPLDFIKQGSEALLDEDFSVRFAMKGTKDMDVLIDVYNKMLDKIRSERTYQQEQHYFLDSMLEILPVGVVILDYDDNIAQYNHHAGRILSLNETDIGQDIKHSHSELRKALVNIAQNESKVVKSGGVDYFRCTCQQFIHRGFPRKYFVLEDISTEILATEKQAYGKVIRMMSHEVNNSIGAINSILDSLLSYDMSAEELEEYLTIVIDRNDKLAQFMKNFAEVIRLPEPAKRSFDLVRSIQNLVALYRHIAQQQEIEFILDIPDVYTIHADPEQIEQFLLNVMKNSIEAIGQNGTIQIQIQADTLRIIDNGCGIPKSIQEQLFSPFFSTKTTGQGVGLTLVKQILFQHEFPFNLSSDAGATCFEVKLNV